MPSDLSPEDFRRPYMGEFVPQRPTTVAHWEDREPGYVYIGRKGGGYFGNPFSASSVCGHSAYRPMGRAEAIRHYEEWFYDKLIWDDVFRERVQALAGKQLVCHCKPLACHGDIIKEYLDGLVDPATIGQSMVDLLRQQGA